MEGTLCRAVRAKYLRRTPPQPLYYGGSEIGARYTPRGGPAGLYLASDPATALAEIRDLMQSPRGQLLPSARRDPVTLVYVETEVGRVLDLTDATIRRALRIGRKAIMAEWHEPMLAYLAGKGPMPLTQQIGVAAHISGIVGGILFPSVRWKGGLCLVVFPDRLAKGDRVASYDPEGVLAQVLMPPAP
ncbi:MAG TPA: RES family NAD+ phosphorylase [Longimicrobiaceae bacterium]|nr:RES family NAD+ phosphorylase [Longimicrobiaceae bacterium]